VTFLFSDIEGSTRRWEVNPEAMRSELAAHDEVLRSAIEARGGWLFKHTGDGVCAAFGSAGAAVDAAVEAQRRLDLPVRMAVVTGEAEERNGDYFGPVLNRTARVMAAGHGGQILVAASAASLLDGVELVDLGVHRLRDLSGATQLFQVRAEGIAVQFPPLRTRDVMPGNLPAQLASFVGREMELKALGEFVRAHRLVTLTGVGGVGKTRLALQVAADVATEFPHGAWLVELAPVVDPGSVPDAVASALGVTLQGGLSANDAVVQALSGRRLLVVLDNCEHVLGAAGDLVEAILTRAASVTLLATSREGLRVPAEQLWPVPPLDVDGAGSNAVELFVERAREAKPEFVPSGAGELDAVVEVCRRVDGIALAIELAAARIVSMSPQDICDHLGERFRLLSGPQRGVDRHQTLRNTVRWSYDLLDDDERMVLGCCSVFAGGFDLAAATHICTNATDEYVVMDRLDSLVRKSLVTAESVAGHARYGLLETIRQFVEEQVAAAGSIDALRNRHARYYADRLLDNWQLWDGPSQRVAIGWVDVELANLRAAFRWAADHDDVDTAADIAAHTARLAFALQRYEPVKWAEEIVEVAAARDIRQLSRVYSAAGLCTFRGFPEDGLAYVRAALALEADPSDDAFEPGWTAFLEAAAHVFAGRIDRYIEVCARLAGETGRRRTLGLGGLTWALPAVGRAGDAMDIADEALAAAREYGNPFWIATALYAYERAFSHADPARALDAARRGITYARDNHLTFVESIIAQDAAYLEARHGDLLEALALFERTIDSCNQSGDHANIAATLAYLAAAIEPFDLPDVSAILFGFSSQQASTIWVIDFTALSERLRSALGKAEFDRCVTLGATMSLADAIRYANEEIADLRASISTERQSSPLR
jgi:predicted ATPase